MTVTTRLITRLPCRRPALRPLEDADRVVLGSRGLGTFSELLLGSVSLELASRAPCPVVVIRPRTISDHQGAARRRRRRGRRLRGLGARARAGLRGGLPARGGASPSCTPGRSPFFELPGKGGPIPESVLVDTFEGEELRWLSEELAGWREKYPEVTRALRGAPRWCGRRTRRGVGRGRAARRRVARAGRVPDPAPGVGEPRRAAPRALPGHGRAPRACVTPCASGPPRAGRTSGGGAASRGAPDSGPCPSTPPRTRPRSPGPPSTPVTGWCRCPTGPSRRAPTSTPWSQRSVVRCPTAPPTRPRSWTLLAEAAEPGLMAMGSGRFYGWVIGGTLPAALAADWLVSAWDQNTGLRFATPATAAAEEVAGAGCSTCSGCRRPRTSASSPAARWRTSPGSSSGRHALLTEAGLGPRPATACTADRASPCSPAPSGTTRSTSRCATSGWAQPTAVAERRAGPDPAGRPGRRPRGGRPGPVLVCLQAGNVHSGAFDPLGAAIELAHARGAWVHVDGAFGLFAGRLTEAAAPRGGLRGGRLVGHGRPQDPQRAVRLRHRDRQPAARPCAGRSGCTPSYLIQADASGPGGPVGQGARAVAPGARGAGVGGAAVAGARRGRRPRRRDGGARAGDRRRDRGPSRAPRCSTRCRSPRCARPSAPTSARGP